MEVKTKVKAAEENNGKATEEQIQAWKKMWGEVTEIKVKEHFCYLKPLTRTVMKLGLGQLSIKVNTESSEAEMDMGKIIELGEIVLQNCWLGGSEEFQNNDVLWVNAAMQAGELFELAETSLKKY